MILDKRNLNVIGIGLAMFTFVTLSGIYLQNMSATSQKQMIEPEKTDNREKQESDIKLANPLGLNHANLLNHNLVIDEFQVTQGIQASNKDSSQTHLVRNSDNDFKTMLVRVAAHHAGTTAISVTAVAQIDLGNGFAQESHYFTSTAQSIYTQTQTLVNEDVITIPVKFSSFLFNLSVLTATVKLRTLNGVPEDSPSPDPVTYGISETHTPQIFFYPVKFPDFAEPLSTTISTTSAAGFVKGILPVADSEDFYRSVPYNTLHCPVIEVGKPDKLITAQNGKLPNSSRSANIPSEACVILHHLTALRNGLATCGMGPDPYTAVYGWVKDEPLATTSVVTDNGYSSQLGRVGFGNTLAIRGQRTFAHELTHMFGMMHPTEGTTVTVTPPGVDIGSGLLGGDFPWNHNGITSTVKSTNLLDLRHGGKNTNQAWIADNSYNDFLNQLPPQDFSSQGDCLTNFWGNVHFDITTTQTVTLVNQLDTHIISDDLKRVFANQGHSLDSTQPFTVVVISLSNSWMIVNVQKGYLVRLEAGVLQIYQIKESRPAVGSYYCVAKNDNSTVNNGAASGQSEYVAIPFPTFIWPWQLQPIPLAEGTEGLFTLNLETLSGQILSNKYDPRIGSDPELAQNDLVYGYFSGVAPYSDFDEVIARITITDDKGFPVPILDPVSQTFGNSLVNRFPNQPFRVTITSPSRQATDPPQSDVIQITTPSFPISWTVSTLNGQNPNRIEYQVLYSHDGGRIWLPVAVNLPGDVLGITVNREELCTTNNNRFNNNLLGDLIGIIRVLASDGLNTASDEVYVSLIGNPVLSPSYCERGLVSARDLTPRGEILQGVDRGLQ